jgi:hypothetical protein
MNSATHSTAILRSAAGHVAYELRMWQWAANLLNGIGPEQQNTPERNALIESYLLHLRNLIEFFRSEGRKTDDVVALLYVPRWNVGDYGSSLESAWVSLNKRLNHITMERLNKSAWPIVEHSWQLAHDAVGILWLKFESELGEDRRAWFHPQISAS